MVNPNGASVGDIDGDGDMEVLIGGSRNEGVKGFHHDGRSVAGFPLYVDPSSRSSMMTPVLADLDRDGDVEIIARAPYLAAWDLPGDYDPAKIEWGMYQHDPYRTGNYNANINLPPVWYIAPEHRVFVRNVDNELRARAIDPEGTRVLYDVQDLPTGAEYESGAPSLRFRWQPQVTDVGADVTFCAIDEDGERVAKTIHITLVDAPIDLDGDGDLDLDDHGRFITCFNGPGRPLVHPDCDPADIDHDGDVDIGDFVAAQRAFGASW
jgi:hypothetical protein